MIVVMSETIKLAEFTDIEVDDYIDLDESNAYAGVRTSGVGGRLFNIPSTSRW